MLLPSFLTAASAFLCERVLIEKDDAISAIRIVDIYFVPEPTAEARDLKIGDPIPPGTTQLMFYVVAMLQAAPEYKGSHKVEIRVLSSRGEWNEVRGPMYDLTFEQKIAGVPAVEKVLVQMNLIVRNLGTAYICVFLDEREVVRTPLTTALLRTPQA